MKDKLDMSDISNNLSKEIDEMFEKEEKKDMDEAVDKAEEVYDDLIEDISEEEMADEDVSDEEEEVISDGMTEVKEDALSDNISEDVEEGPSDNDTELPELDLSDVNMEFTEEDRKAAHILFGDDEDDNDEMFENVNSALSARVEKQLGPSFADLLDEEEAENETDEDASEEDDDDMEKAAPTWLKVVLIALFAIVLIGLFLLFTKPGHSVISHIAAKFVTSHAVIEDPDKVVQVDERNLDPDVSILTPDNNDNNEDPNNSNVSEDPEVTPVPTVAVVDFGFEDDDSVINILIIGEENYYKDVRGRSDSMMIASMDKDGGNLKLMSFMRDMYVEIPGHSDNKLNAAYSIGGAPLLMKTLEKNFGLKCDGYVLVRYEGFEAIVDLLGGLDITLTEEEAKHMNSKDYISDPAQRNVVAGLQHLTGCQVLAYCRNRFMPTTNGLYADWGRTYRQRTVLKMLFDKYKSKPYNELYSIMIQCLKYVTISEGLDNTIADCLQIVFEKNMFELDTYRVPIDDANGRHYAEATINNQSVLCFYPDTPQLIHDILYGTGE